MPRCMCMRCGKIKDDVVERYSCYVKRVYAGRLCIECCKCYPDYCGIDQPQGSLTKTGLGRERRKIMEIKARIGHNRYATYGLQQIKRMTCPAGTTYWIVQAIDEDGHCVWSHNTDAIYGAPKMDKLALVARAAIEMAINPQPIDGPPWLAEGVSWFGQQIAYGQDRDAALNNLARRLGCTHYNADTGSNQAAYLYHPTLGKLCVTHFHVQAEANPVTA